MENKGLQTCKYVMFVMNLIIFVCGLALVILGIWVYANGENFQELVSSSPAIFHSVAIIIAVGGVLLVAGFFGCLGAIRENRCLLGTYFAIVLMLFIVEIVAAILIFVYYPRAKEIVIASMKNYNDTTKVPWDSVQSTFRCCGYNSPADWTANDLLIPSSCCGNSTLFCDAESPSVFNIGCEQVLNQYFWVIAGVSIGVLVFELLSMIFSCCLFRSIADYEMA